MLITNSSRLSYQFIDERDKDFLFQLDQDPEVMRYLNGGEPSSRQTIEETFMPRLQAYKNSDKGWGLWKVTIIESQQNIGWILARPMAFFSDNPKFNDIELGWRFFQSSWGKGYATEAAQHILAILSQDSDYHYFSATALENNIASVAVMKKLGMECVKSYLHSDKNFNETTAVLYRLTNMNKRQRTHK